MTKCNSALWEKEWFLIKEKSVQVSSVQCIMGQFTPDHRLVRMLWLTGALPYLEKFYAFKHTDNKDYHCEIL